MKIVTRSGVFETNSSSVHSYTCPIKSERISFKDWARSKADKDKVVNIDFDWWIDETGDVSPDNKLALVLSGIPAFWQNQEDYDRYISYAEVQENETYKEIIRRLELRSGYILNLNYSNEKFYIQRPIYSDECDDDEIIFDNDFYADLDNVLDFIENPEWRMGVHEYRDS
jgi:hypothetical protein